MARTTLPTTVAAHRAPAPTWNVHVAFAAVTAAAGTARDWLATPVRATRRTHAFVATGYALVAVNAGLAVILLGAHR